MRLTWLVTAGAAMMPTIMVDALHAGVVWHYFGAPPILAFSLDAIGLLWWRRSSVLDLWLLVVLWAWLIETVLLSTTAYRFSLVWYAGRIYGLLSSSFVLLVPAVGIDDALCAAGAVGPGAASRARGRLMTLEAMSAAIAHEIKQPLGAIVANANAGSAGWARPRRRWTRIADTLKDIAADGHRASEVIQSVRAMFSGERAGEAARLDANGAHSRDHRAVRGELEAAKIAVQLEACTAASLVSAHRGQLQQVVLNVVANAADAMRMVTDRAHVLRVESRPSRSGGVPYE